MAQTQLMEYAIYNVIAVIDTISYSDRNPSNPEFVLTTSNACYCTPTIEFWLSLDDLEHPATEPVLLEFMTKRPKSSQVKFIKVYFDWLDTRYEGCFIPKIPSPLPWANGKRSHGKIIDIKWQAES